VELIAIAYSLKPIAIGYSLKPIKYSDIQAIKTYFSVIENIQLPLASANGTEGQSLPRALAHKRMELWTSCFF
jgi:hypothetical protein